MIKIIDKRDDHWLIALGLEPGNIDRMKKGDPVFVRLRDMSPECPDYTISIGQSQHVHPPNPADNKKHISMNFEPTVLDRMVQGEWSEKEGKVIHPPKIIPLHKYVEADPTVPNLKLMIFYTENPTEFEQEIRSEGIRFQRYLNTRGKRPVAHLPVTDFDTDANDPRKMN
jgi:hypothetical protein